MIYSNSFFLLKAWYRNTTWAYLRVSQEIGLLQKSNCWETKHHTRRVGELRFIKPAVPDELTPSSSGAFWVQGELYFYGVSTHNYSWHWLIGYLVAMGYRQLQSVGVVMGYVQGISKQKLVEAETEHSILIRASYNYKMLGHLVPISVQQASYRSRMSMKLFLAESKF